MDLGKVNISYYPSGPVQDFLDINFHPSIIFAGVDEEECEDFYQFLTTLWGKFTKLLVNLPTNVNDLWHRGHEIKNKIHDIMAEWEECDDKLMGTGVDPQWTKIRGDTSRKYAEHLRDLQMGRERNE